MAVIFNAKGTTSPYFLLGKGGTTLYQGSSDPTGSYTASAGDVWFDTNANTLKFRNAGNSAWEQGSLAGGDLNVTGDATITGDLTVNGTTTIVDTTNLVIEDSLLLLSRNTTTAAMDSGFIVERGSSTNVGVIWDESADKFACVIATEDGTTAGDISISSYADLQVAGFTSSTVDLNGGAIDGTVIGGSSAAAGTFTTLIAATLGGALDAGNQNITNIDVDSGAIDGTVIGAASAAAITGTTITATNTSGTAAQSFVRSYGSGSEGSTLLLESYNTGGANYGSRLEFRKSNSNTLGTLVDVDDGDYLGQIHFAGVSRSNAGYNGGAYITGVVDGAENTYTPTNIVFHATSATAVNHNILVVHNDGKVGIGTATPAATLDVTGTDAMIIPVGTTAQRPGSPEAGMIRFNSTVSRFEGYDGSNWLYIDIPEDLGDA